MTAPADQAAALTVPTWGVWDQHLREWVVPATFHRERDAWAALLAVDSLHPWELIVQKEQQEKPKPVFTECPACFGSGDCDGCGRDCTRCDGDGEVAWDELATYEQERQKRLGTAPKAVQS